jgi:hypothetical protein
MAILVLLAGCGDSSMTMMQPDAPSSDRLSALGLYADIHTKRISSSALEYTPAYEAWADGAHKRRFLVLPPGAKIDTSDMDHWQFPVGTKLFKEFSVDGRPVETRLIEKVDDTGSITNDFTFTSYVWQADGSEAYLAPAAGAQDVSGTDHDVPSQAECVMCHQSERGGILGFSAVQLSKSEQPNLMSVSALLSAPPAAMTPIPGDAATAAALGFLHANCGHCHTDGGVAPPPRFRLLTADAARLPSETVAYTSTVGVPIEGWPTHPSDVTLRIAPGDPDHSGVLYRMSHRGTIDQMPPIATEVVDWDATAILRAWILAMPVQ